MKLRFEKVNHRLNNVLFGSPLLSAMWFSVALWTVFAFLVCSTVAYSSSHHSGFQDYDSTPQKTHPSYIEGKSEEDPWRSLSRGIFDGKATSSAESSASDDANLLATLEDSDPDEPLNQRHEKRDSHSLSIVNPLDVLRQRLMLEMARRRMKENQEQIRENAVILKNLGKRGSARENYLRRIHVSSNEDFDV
ncbi:hypothetical protein JTE90_026090 [Oedothorax gibbosus]|uniref:Corticotropin-releasing factor domain-containing protein n=1 Tax=Oedothorax gibbosus TaxID=931172 RepID=A0AAV6UPX9_9ARAC|nr:hypothetical protein JTE90_026090 [Oedothorax gibbosus]